MEVSASSLRVPAVIWARLQRVIAGLCVSVISDTANYRDTMLARMRNVAIGWGGVCESAVYQGYLVSLYFTCEAGHRFRYWRRRFAWGSGRPTSVNQCSGVNR